MNDVVLIALFVAIALLLLMSAVLTYLWREHKKLKQDIQALDKKLHGSIDDVAGLCSAAVTVDQRLAFNEMRLTGVLESLHEPEPQARYDEPIDEVQPQGYELAIEKIRRGASVDDLVKSCGLTRDEAVLLVRLHSRN